MLKPFDEEFIDSSYIVVTLAALERPAEHIGKMVESLGECIYTNRLYSSSILELCIFEMSLKSLLRSFCLLQFSSDLIKVTI